MVRCQLLDMDSGDFYADAPSGTHSGKSAATLPIDHRSDVDLVFSVKYQQPIMICKDSWDARDFAAHNSTFIMVEFVVD